MFGHNNNDVVTQDQQNNAQVPMPDETIDDLTSAAPIEAAGQPASAPLVVAEAPQTHHSFDGLINPEAAPADNTTNLFPAPSDALGKPEPRITQPASSLLTATTEPHHDALLDIKQGALQALSPLVSTLDLEPAEKFKTIMMLIQASDDHSLLSQAYETAQSIPNEPARAQALLDVVNEINYFTHPNDQVNS